MEAFKVAFGLARAQHLLLRQQADGIDLVDGGHDCIMKDTVRADDARVARQLIAEREVQLVTSKVGDLATSYQSSIIIITISKLRE